MFLLLLQLVRDRDTTSNADAPSGNVLLLFAAAPAAVAAAAAPAAAAAIVARHHRPRHQAPSYRILTR